MGKKCQLYIKQEYLYEEYFVIYELSLGYQKDSELWVSLSAVTLVIDMTIAGILCMCIKWLCILPSEKHGVFKPEKIINSASLYLSVC